MQQISLTIIALALAVQCGLGAAGREELPPAIIVNAAACTLPISKASGQTLAPLAKFAPRGWHMLASATGDLNDDGRIDAVMIYSKSSPLTDKAIESDEALSAPRLLVIALRDEKKRLRKTVESDQLILCRSCGVMLSEPLTRLEIQDGKVIIEQNILGNCDASLTQAIGLSGEQWEFTVEINTRERRTGRERTVQHDKPMPLTSFNISEINVCGGVE